jgi:hypothetical protein
MLTERVRHRLEQLNRAAVAPLAGSECRPATDPLTPLALHRRSSDGNAPLAGDEVGTTWGPHWLVRQPIESVWPASRHYLWPEARPAESPPTDQPDCNSINDDLTALRRSFPRKHIYLDLETCGFAGSMVFLVGVVYWDQHRMMLSQLWARDYAEEKAMLQSLWSMISEDHLLITFNGKSFDWPQVNDRSTLHHLGPHPQPRHFDLLHHARRRWRSQLPNCRLQTLERYICGRHRIDDVPGSRIPQAYHDYVRSGQTNEVRSILHHNAMDLITLLQLTLLFVRV